MILVTAEKPPRTLNQGNLYKDIEGHLALLCGNQRLDVVTLVDRASGKPLARFERTGTKWKLKQVRIAPHLQLHADTTSAAVITANDFGTIQGVQFGTTAFEVPAERVTALALAPLRSTCQPHHA